MCDWQVVDTRLKDVWKSITTVPTTRGVVCVVPMAFLLALSLLPASRLAMGER